MSGSLCLRGLRDFRASELAVCSSVLLAFPLESWLYFLRFWNPAVPPCLLSLVICLASCVPAVVNLSHNLSALWLPSIPLAQQPSVRRALLLFPTSTHAWAKPPPCCEPTPVLTSCAHSSLQWEPSRLGRSCQCVCCLWNLILMCFFPFIFVDSKILKYKTST